tara:strand:+ start:10195 stop:10974 length:780 start_codon:yes stop_codon:yes gene_type:complete
MPRTRSIKPEFFDDPDIGDLSPFARLLFIGLWVQADREGRLVDDHRRLKIRLLPFDDVDVEGLLAELSSKGMILRYQDSAGVSLIWVCRFLKHQRPHIKENASVLTPCTEKPGKSGASTGKVVSRPGKSGTNPPGTCSLVPGTGSLVLGAGEDLAVNAKPATAELTFQCVGQKPEWYLDLEQVDVWATAYPNLDILAECRRANAYIDANPSKRKTAGGMPRFLVAWFNRSTDSARGSSQPAASQDAEVLRRFVARGENL